MTKVACDGCGAERPQHHYGWLTIDAPDQLAQFRVAPLEGLDLCPSCVLRLWQWAAAGVSA